MKAGLTIQEMSKEILRQSQAKTDYLVNTANLRMEPWGNEPTTVPPSWRRLATTYSPCRPTCSAPSTKSPAWPLNGPATSHLHDL